MNKVTDILENVSSVIIGKNDVAELVMTSIIAGGFFWRMFREQERP